MIKGKAVAAIILLTLIALVPVVSAYDVVQVATATQVGGSGNTQVVGNYNTGGTNVYQFASVTSVGGINNRLFAGNFNFGKNGIIQIQIRHYP